MIWNQWYVVLESKDVRAGRPVGVRRLGERMVFWRTANGKLVCQKDQCPHRGAALSAGKLVGDHVECPFHGFQFDSRGACTLIPALGRETEPPKSMRVATYAVHEEHGMIWIWWGDARENLPPVPFFEALEEGFSYGSLQDAWPVHYSRAIENQLDVVHLPFVHRTTIGRGERTVSDGPQFKWERDEERNLDRLNIWVYNRVEDGERSRKASELSEPSRRPFLQFQFPNIWHNWIGDDVRVFAAFVPVDEENTRMIVRFYQRVVRVPGLAQLFNWLAMPFNGLILRQDKEVVVTQRPLRSGLRIGERLIHGDGPIVAYRRHREELQGEASSR